MSLVKLSAASTSAQIKVFTKLFNKKPDLAYSYGRVATLSKHLIDQSKELKEKFPLNIGLKNATNHLKNLLKENK